LKLNKCFLVGAGLWGFILAIIASSQALQTACPTAGDRGFLNHIAAFGIALWCVAAAMDFIIETFQDSVYSCCTNSGPGKHENDDKANDRKAWHVPDDYVGISHQFFAPKDFCCTSPTKGGRTGAWLILFTETLLRAGGNGVLIALTVTSSMFPWQAACIKASGNNSTSSMVAFQDLNAPNYGLFWATVVINVIRLMIAFTYPDPVDPKTVTTGVVVAGAGRAAGAPTPVLPVLPAAPTAAAPARPKASAPVPEPESAQDPSQEPSQDPSLPKESTEEDSSTRERRKRRERREKRREKRRQRKSQRQGADADEVEMEEHGDDDDDD